MRNARSRLPPAFVRREGNDDYEAYLSPAPYNFLDHHTPSHLNLQLDIRFSLASKAYNSVVDFSIIPNRHQHRQNIARGRPGRVACYLQLPGVTDNEPLSHIHRSPNKAA